MTSTSCPCIVQHNDSALTWRYRTRFFAPYINTRYICVCVQADGQQRRACLHEVHSNIFLCADRRSVYRYSSMFQRFSKKRKKTCPPAEARGQTRTRTKKKNVQVKARPFLSFTSRKYLLVQTPKHGGHLSWSFRFAKDLMSHTLAAFDCEHRMSYS